MASGSLSTIRQVTVPIPSISPTVCVNTGVKMAAGLRNEELSMLAKAETTGKQRWTLPSYTPATIKKELPSGI